MDTLLAAAAIFAAFALAFYVLRKRTKPQPEELKDISGGAGSTTRKRADKV